jgi:hypothetical protein
LFSFVSIHVCDSSAWSASSSIINHPFIFIFKMLLTLTVAQLIASVPYAFRNIYNVSSPFFQSFTQNSITHFCHKTYEILFCSAIPEHVSYKSSYKNMLWKTTTFALVAKRLEEESTSCATLIKATDDEQFYLISFQGPLV